MVGTVYEYIKISEEALVVEMHSKSVLVAEDIFILIYGSLKTDVVGFNMFDAIKTTIFIF